MAHQGIGERVVSLKAHVYSGNANSSTAPSIHQANCVGTQIYSSNLPVTPPLQSNSKLASFKIPATTGRTCDNFNISNSRQATHISTENISRTNTELSEKTNNSFEFKDADVQIDSTAAQQQSNLQESFNVVSRDVCLTQNPSKTAGTPIVVITPASTLDSHLEMDSNVEANSNGEVDGISLNDGVDSCSLSSIYSEDDIQTTDDDPSESDCASQLEEKTRKVSNWKKIRRVIHWSPFVQNFKKRYPWVQLAGHQGSFKAGENGTILKKTTAKEKECLIKLMKDILRPYVPEYKKEVENDGEKFIQMQDLLQDFENPCIMDCKMGVRTYLEEELAKAKSKPRKDLYQKMVDVDPSEPTESENKAKAITKPRYMQWRERLSSSATLGFRIEGIKKGDQKPNKDFKKTKTNDDVAKVFTEYIEGDPQLRMKYLRRLKAIRATLEVSEFFRAHEVIGSSLLFVHDSNGAASIWMIDFGKTTSLQDGVFVDHRTEWKEGNREDGYLWGLDKMIEVWTLR